MKFATANLRASQKALHFVTPAEAGVQNPLAFLDSGFRRNDEKQGFRAFNEIIKFVIQVVPVLQKVTEKFL